MSANPLEPPGELSYENILKLLEDSDWPLATADVAAAFEITQQSAHYRLTELEKRGEVEKRIAGGNAALWRVTPDQESSRTN